MKKRSLWLCPLAIAAIVTLDQWVKAYIVTHFAVGESKPFLPQLLRLHYVRNFGAAWSSFSGERWLLIGVTGVGCSRSHGCSRESCGTRSACGR